MQGWLRADSRSNGKCFIARDRADIRVGICFWVKMHSLIQGSLLPTWSDPTIANAFETDQVTVLCDQMWVLKRDWWALFLQVGDGEGTERGGPAKSQQDSSHKWEVYLPPTSLMIKCHLPLTQRCDPLGLFYHTYLCLVLTSVSLVFTWSGWIKLSHLHFIQYCIAWSSIM